MYKKFIIEIANPKNHNDSILCEFNIRPDDLSQQWAGEIFKDYNIYERDRFAHWPSDIKDNVYYADKLNEQIDIINSYYPGKITLRAEPNMDQITMNKMHVFFEQLRGPIEDPLEWFLNSTSEVKKSIERLNLLTHEYEYAQLYKEWEEITHHPNAMIVGTYDNRPRFELDDKDYYKFTYNFTFGTVYINYCVVGKPILDVFLNQDDDIGDDNIRPQHHWSADWMIKFGAALPDWKIKEMELQFWDWFGRKENFFNSLGIERGPKLALGQIPVADINKKCFAFNGLSDLDIVYKLAPYQYLKETWVE